MDATRFNCDFDFGLHYSLRAIRRDPSAVPACSLLEWCNSNGGYINASSFNLVANLHNDFSATSRTGIAKRVQSINQEILRVAEVVGAAREVEFEDKRRLNAAAGFLELGRLEEAERELDRVSDALQGHPDVILARLRIWVTMGA